MTDNAELWAVHLIGPDDLLACVGREAAVRNAMRINLTLYRQHIADAVTPYAPMAWAVPVVWPLSAAGHAEDLTERCIEDPRWSDPSTDLTALAAAAFGNARPMKSEAMF